MCSVEAVVGHRIKLGPISVGKVWGRLDPNDHFKKSATLQVQKFSLGDCSIFGDYSETVALAKDNGDVVVAPSDGAIIRESEGVVLRGNDINTSPWRGKLRYRDGNKQFLGVGKLAEILKSLI